MSFSIILEAFILAASLSLDAFMVSFAYGSNNIRIPFISIQIITVVCSAVVGLSLLVGAIIRPYLPIWLTTVICFGILFVLGVIKLLDGIVKSLIRRYSKINKELRFSMFNLGFILNIYADPVIADIDASRHISPGEAFSLALAVSLDGLAVGFGAAMGNVNALAVVLSSLVTTVIAVLLGCFVGNKLAKKATFNLTWVCGVTLLMLAFAKLF